MDFIGKLFGDLTYSQKVEMMAVLYFNLTDSERDEFLRQIENA